MKHLEKIVGINLLVMLIYSVVIRFSLPADERALGILIVSAWVVGLHVAVNLVISLVYVGDKQHLGKAWLLSTGIVLLVGFSTCLGNAML